MSITVNIDYDKLAQKVVGLLSPQMERLEMLLKGASAHDMITVKEAMGILCLKSRKAIYERIEGGKLQRFGEGKKILLSKTEVQNLAKA